jgi:hypothetical protein
MHAVPKNAWLLTLLLLAAGAAFYVETTSRALPADVASHFGVTGAANGFMPRDFYVRLMLALLVGLPVLVGLLPSVLIGRPNARINLPNGHYWLAPERRDASLRFLRNHLVRFGLLLLAFVCAVHRQILHANLLVPPQLSMAVFMRGLIVYLLCVAVWTVMLFARFAGSER